jgi:hypothetical protein
MADTNTYDGLKKHSLLTTIDNPYNPFTEFDKWNNFDVEKGYHTNSYLARIVKSSDELSDFDQVLAIEEAIDEILEYNVLGIYVKVTEENFINRSKFANLSDI